MRRFRLQCRAIRSPRAGEGVHARTDLVKLCVGFRPAPSLLPLLFLGPSIFLLLRLHLLLLSEKLRYTLTPRLIASVANAVNSRADHSRRKRRRTATKIGYRELRHPLEIIPPSPKTVTQLN